MLADLFNPVDRTIAVAVFAGSTFVGPVAGPIVGGFITMSYLGWRWTEYITAIMAFFLMTLGFFIVPETFEPTILQRRARRLRFKTKNWALHANSEEQPISPRLILQKYLLRPMQMLVLEPILLLITLYMGFIYGFLYLCFEAYPVAFQEDRGWNEGVGALPFVAITCGVVVGCGIIVAFAKTRVARMYKEMGTVIPEERLIPMMIGGVLLPAGMFWYVPQSANWKWTQLNDTYK
jgi:DHA1 family multidrug resistance protein-like MFS transporter